MVDYDNAKVSACKIASLDRVGGFLVLSLEKDYKIKVIIV